MFGEKPIYGQTHAHTDDKCRIKLPAFTNAEKSDRLLLVESSEGLKVVREDDFDNMIASLQKKYEEETEPKKYIALEKRMLALFLSVIKSCSCDRERRVTLTNILKPNTEYLVIGCRNSILIKSPKKENTEDNKILGLTMEKK